jgi:hypothetical protein
MPIVIEACDMRRFFVYVISNFPLFDDAMAKALETSELNDTEHALDMMIRFFRILVQMEKDELESKCKCPF